MKITIPGELPDLNQIIDKSKRHWAEYSKMKQQYTESVAWRAKKLQKMKRIFVTFRWFCPNRRKDQDNIAVGQKFILDGLVKAGVIPDDSWKHIEGFTHHFEVDKHNPRVEIEIEEAKRRC